MKNLEKIWITEGINGYPKNEHQVISSQNFANFEELQKFAKENGFEIGVYKQRPGWQHWEYAGTYDLPYELDWEYFDDEGYYVIDRNSSVEEVKESFFQEEDYFDGGDAQRKLYNEFVEKIQKMSENLKENEVVAVPKFTESEITKNGLREILSFSNVYNITPLHWKKGGYNYTYGLFKL